MNPQAVRFRLCDSEFMGVKRKVLSLIRVSSVEQADPEKDGIPRQLRHIAEHCRKFNLEIGKGDEYRLEGISGAKVQYNPQFQAMIRRLAEPEISGVVFSRMDRFFRPEHLDAYEIFKTFRKEKKLLFCDLASDDGLNVTKPQDQMKIQLWGMVAAQERRNIAERNREGKEASRRKDDRKSDPLPVGVTWDESTGKFSYDTEYTKKVKEAFNLVIAGATLNTIVHKVGFASQTGLRKILRNQWWIGNKTHLLRREYRDESDTNGRKVPLEKPVIVRTNLAQNPLISSDDFERVQRILDVRVKTWTQRESVSANFLGPGLLRCQCGQKMYLKKGTSYGVGKGMKPNYYVCASKCNGGKASACKNLSCDTVEMLIAFTAMKYFIDESFIRGAIERNLKAINREEIESEVERLRKSIRALEAKKERAVDLSFVDDAYVARVKTFSAEIVIEQARLAKAKAELASQLNKQDVADMAWNLREKFYNFNPALDDESEWTQSDRKKVLNETIERITFYDDLSCEFVLKGGLLLGPPMSDEEALASYYGHAADALDGELALLDVALDHDGGSVKSAAKQANFKGKKIVKIKTRMGRGSWPPPA